MDGWIGVGASMLLAEQGTALRLRPERNDEACELVISWIRKGYDVRMLDEGAQGSTLMAQAQGALGLMIPVAGSLAGCARILDRRTYVIERPPEPSSVPIAAWLNQVATDFETRQTDLPLVMVVAAMDGHVEVTLNDAMRESELLTRGVTASIPPVLDEMFDGPEVGLRQMSGAEVVRLYEDDGHPE